MASLPDLTTEMTVLIDGGLVVRPGDTLIVRVDRNISREDFDEFVAGIRKRIPEDVKILVVEAAQLAVYRPDQSD